MTTAAALSKRISQLEGAHPGEQQIIYVAWGEGEPFARLEGDECINLEDLDPE